MDIAGRLRLLRSLHCLSQAEMADLIGVSRIFYTNIELRRKKLPADIAETVEKTFYFNVGQTIQKESKPLQGLNLLIVEYPPQRLSLLSDKDEKRRLSDASRELITLLPQFLHDNKLRLIWIAKPSKYSSLVLCNVAEDQFLLLCFNLDYSTEEINDVLAKPFETLRALPHTIINVDLTLFCKIKLWSSNDVGLLLERCGVSEDLRDKIKIQLRRSYAAHYMLETRLQKPAKEQLLDKIVTYLVNNDINISEVKDALEKIGREDLI